MNWFQRLTTYLRQKRRERAIAALAAYKARITRELRRGRPMPDQAAEKAILQRIYRIIRA